MTSPRPDLSGLPANLRQKLEAQLERLPSELRNNLYSQLSKVPPDQLARFVERSSPILDKALANVEQVQSGMSARKSTTVDVSRSSHFNGTVRPGDPPGLVGKVLLVLVVILVFAYLF